MRLEAVIKNAAALVCVLFIFFIMPLGMAAQCSDPDGGKNYKEAVTTTDEQLSNYDDECVWNGKLREHYCDPNCYQGVCSELIQCSDEFGSGWECQDGACVQTDGGGGSSEPDIWVNDGIQIDPTSPDTNDVITYTATISKTGGSGSSATIGVEFKVDGTTVCIKSDTIIHGTTVSCTDSQTRSAGTHQINVFVDPQDVSDSDTSNNEKTESFSVDSGGGGGSGCTDQDGDGYGANGNSACPNSGTDCNDGNAQVNPGVSSESGSCSDGLDNDCDGQTDGADSDCRGGGGSNKACCVQSRCFVVSQSRCQSLGGTIKQAQSCAQVNCGGGGGSTQPCCRDGQCGMLSPDLCRDAGGTVKSGNSCSAVSCGDGNDQQPCCANGQCAMLTQQQCQNIGGTTKSGNSCSAVSCDSGTQQQPCCINNQCSMMNPSECQADGGTVKQGNACDSVSCDGGGTQCGNDDCEQGENVSTCPQDCQPSCIEQGESCIGIQQTCCDENSCTTAFEDQADSVCCGPQACNTNGTCVSDGSTYQEAECRNGFWCGDGKCRKGEQCQTDCQTEPKNQTPNAAFSITPENPQVNQEVTFDASASHDPDGGSIESYQWVFGDGTTQQGDALQQVTHTYTEAGEISIWLLITDDEQQGGGTMQTICVGDAQCEQGSKQNLLQLESGWNTAYLDTETSIPFNVVENTCGSSIAAFTLQNGSLQREEDILQSGTSYLLRVKQQCSIDAETVPLEKHTLTLDKGWDIAGTTEDLSVDALKEECTGFIAFGIEDGSLYREKDTLAAGVAYLSRTDTTCQYSF